MLKLEMIKIKRNVVLFVLIILVPVVINILLTIDLRFRYDYLLGQREELGYSYWQLIYKEQNIFNINEFIPLLGALLIFILFSYEVRYRAWNNIKILCKSSGKIVISKYIIAVVVSTIMIIINNLTLIPVGRITGVETPIEWDLIFKAIIAQLISVVAVIALSLFVIAVIKKVVQVIPISILLFVLSLFAIRSGNGVLGYITPYLYASKCYVQNFDEIMYHFVGMLLWCAFGIIMGTLVINKKDGLE